MPKGKTEKRFTERIIEMLELIGRDCSYKMAADIMGIGTEGAKSLMRNGREIANMHGQTALYRKAVEDGDIKIFSAKGNLCLLQDCHHPIFPFTYT